MKRYSIMALFSDFDEAFGAIADIRHAAVPGITTDDIIL